MLRALVRPVGPEPGIVYWLRRLMVGGVLVVLLGGVYYLLRPLPHARAARPPGATPTATARPTVTATPALTNCADSVLAIGAATNYHTYSSGEAVKLIMTLKNTGRVACRRDVGSRATTWTITSGGYATWGSHDCGVGTATDIRLLKPGQTVTATLTWHRQRSLTGCPTLTGAAKPGYYNLVVANGGLLSGQTSFSIN